MAHTYMYTPRTFSPSRLPDWISMWVIECTEIARRTAGQQAIESTELSVNSAGRQVIECTTSGPIWTAYPIEAGGHGAT